MSEGEELAGMWVCDAWGGLSFLCGWLVYIGHRMAPGIMGALTATGLVYWLVRLYGLWGSLNKVLFTQHTHSADYGAKEGAWALVTGAVDMTGKGFVAQLASEGFNVVLVSAHQGQMDTVVQEIKEARPQAQFKTICVDVADTSLGPLEVVSKGIADLEISMLVNNATVKPMPDYFHDVVDEHLNKVLEVNVHFLTALTKLVFNQCFVKRNEAGKKSAVIMVSSPLAHMPAPFSAVFAATKAYVSTLSISLACEVSEMGIDVLSITPGTIEDRKDMKGLTTCAGVENAAATMTRLGHDDDLECTPWWIHSIQHALFRMVPARTMGGFTYKRVAEAKEKRDLYEALQRKKQSMEARNSATDTGSGTGREPAGVRQRTAAQPDAPDME